MAPAGTTSLLAVIEDDAGLRAAMLRVLGAAGWRVQGYNSAESLLAALAPTGPIPLADLRCLVVDLFLPGLSGFELLDRLDQFAPDHPRARTILITAHDDPRVQQRAREAGAFAYLPKPFTGDALVAAVKSAVNEPHS